MKEYKAPMVQDYRTENCVITAVTTDKTGATTTNLVKLCEAGSKGSKLSAIRFKCQGSSVNSTALIFIRKNAGVYLLFDELTLTAIDSSSTLPSDQNIALYDDLPIGSDIEIYVGITALSGVFGWNAFAIMADYVEAT